MSYAGTRRRRRSVGAIVGALLLAAAPMSVARAQARRTVVLRSPLAEHGEPLTQPATLLELRDGRVLVADSKDRILMLFDFAKGTATQVSRKGSGPLEYQMPTGIFSLADSVVVVDLMQQRMLVLDRAATPLRSHRLLATGDAAASFVRVGTVVAVDGAGHVYSEVRGMTMVAGKMPTISDTVALVRWQLFGITGDTLATRFEHTEMPKMSGSASEGISMKLPITALQPRDAWAVFADGRVGVARAVDYHTEWVDAKGRKVTGPRVPYTLVAVTEGEKARVRKVTRDAYEQGLKLGASLAASGGQKMPKIAMELEEPPSWPKARPPFGVVRAAPDGRLWVTRTIADAGEMMEYDVIAPGGTLERTVQLPKDVTLLGFGRGVLYAVRKDEDDLRYLQRYRLP